MTAVLSPPRVPPALFAAAGYFLPRLMFLDTRYAPHLHWGDVTTALDGFPSEEIDLSSSQFWIEWRDRWVAQAEQHVELAGRSATRAGRSAALRSAAACYHWAEFMYFDDAAVKHQLRQSVRRYFLQSLVGSSLQWQADTVTTPVGEVPIWTLLPDRHDRPAGPLPWVLISNGLDSVTEVEPLSLAEGYLARGIAVVLFEGPGQGLDLGMHPLEPAVEQVAAAVVERVRDHPALAPERNGFVGISFGGYLALRVAQRLPDTFRCVLNFSGGPRVADFDGLPRRLKDDFRFAFSPSGPADLPAILDALTLDPVAGGTQARVLSVQGGRDDIFPLAAVAELAEAWGDRHELVVHPAEGHVCMNKLAQATSMAADWVYRCLQNH